VNAMTPIHIVRAPIESSTRRFCSCSECTERVMRARRKKHGQKSGSDSKRRRPTSMFDRVMQAIRARGR
jgi:hypothetical protein